MGTSSGVATGRRGAYARLIKLGAEAAMAKGWLDGRRWDNHAKKATIEPRGMIIWPGVPKAKDRPLWAKLNPTHWSRPFVGAVFMSAEDIDGDMNALPISA